MTINEKMTALADAIRAKSGRTDTLTLDEMTTAVQSIEVGSGGVDLPELTNEGTAADLMLNKELIDSEGNKVTGTFTIEEELTEQNDLISQLQAALEGKAIEGGGSGGDAEITLQQKTVTPTKLTQTVTPDSSYDGLSKVTVNAIPSEYIIPSGTKSITTNGTHDVTSNASVKVNVPVPSGYVKPTGTKDITENGTHDVASYASVNVAVTYEAGKINLGEMAEGEFTVLTENDLVGVTELCDSAFDDYTKLVCAYDPKSLKIVVLTDATSIGERAFYRCLSLTSIDIPDSVTSIDYEAFRGCTSLTSIEIPDSVTSIGQNAFYDCSSLTSIEIPNSVTSISSRAFTGCYSLTSITIPDSVTSIGLNAFYFCGNLTDVYYTGTEEQWSAITIGSNNSWLTNATIHYNWEG